MGWFKKIVSAADPVLGTVGHYGSKNSKTWRTFYEGASDTHHFWDGNRVLRGISKHGSMPWDPLGNQLNRMFFPENNAVSSAHSYGNTQVYGPSGSIVGRY